MQFHLYTNVTLLCQLVTLVLSEQSLGWWFFTEWLGIKIFPSLMSRKEQVHRWPCVLWNKFSRLFLNFLLCRYPDKDQSDCCQSLSYFLENSWSGGWKMKSQLKDFLSNPKKLCCFYVGIIIISVVSLQKITFMDESTSNQE